VSRTCPPTRQSPREQPIFNQPRAPILSRAIKGIYQTEDASTFAIIEEFSKTPDRRYTKISLPTYVLIGKDGSVVQQYVAEDPGLPVIERIGPDIKKALDQRL
jgi:hypothetical protein